MFNWEENFRFVSKCFDQDIISILSEYIKIPNKSPQFDVDWESHGFMEKAVTLITNWCTRQDIRHMTIEVMRLEKRTPLIFIHVAGNTPEVQAPILLYGHLDKQPEMTGWDPDLSPWNPVLRGDKLYGRGSADDGYAIFAILTAIKSLQQQNVAHGDCIILIEASEESGSTDLPYYIEALTEKIGQPALVICLDSGCGNYEQLWVTTSLRGLVSGHLHINILSQGIHSGLGSGIVPGCFRIARQLLDRIEDSRTGNLLVNQLFVEIPNERLIQADETAKILGKSIYTDIPFLDTVQPESLSCRELILRQTWHPALSIIGINGIPSLQDAGNVTLPQLTLKLSLRLPPTCDAKEAALILKNKLEENPPYLANIKFDIQEMASGWHAKEGAKWLSRVLDQASMQYFGRKAAYLGEGGSIPFMGMLGKKFPHAQFVITGVLGPSSNAHGPNEFLHIPTVKKLTASIAEIIASYSNNHPHHR